MGVLQDIIEEDEVTILMDGLLKKKEQQIIPQILRSPDILRKIRVLTSMDRFIALIEILSKRIFSISLPDIAILEVSISAKLP